MALELYWGSGSPYSWRVLLALEYKQLAYESHELQFS
jgi:glutathione S-transferase